MRKRATDLDDVMSDIDELEKRDSGMAEPGEGSEVEDMVPDVEGRALVGTVEHYYDRIGVAAVKLVAALRVGDSIEISSDDGEIREKVTSMQINRKDVDGALAGDSVGIKLPNRVSEGSKVYRLPNSQDP